MEQSGPGERGAVQRFFKVAERGSTVGREVRAGITTFLTMGYILFVNPQILAAAGMPAEDVAIATILAAAFATLIMGLYANFPFALAPGMGLNAYFTYGVVLGAGVPWQAALAAVFLEGLLFMALAFSGVRTRIINAIPSPIKAATMTGIGLFLAIIGLQNAGLVVDHPATLVTLGNLHDTGPLLAVFGLFLTGALLVRRVPGGMLLSILAVTGLAWSFGVADRPATFFAWPALPDETLLALDLSGLISGALIPVVLAFLFVDIFDTAGSLLGVGRLAGFVDGSGRLPGSDRAFMADASGTVAGSLLGTSTVTTYIESAAGVQEGGRTGLTAVVTALCFLAALFLTPLFVAVPAVATAPALIVVGSMMMVGAVDVDWRKLQEGLPAFLTIIGMPFTYSIANGICFGILSYVAIKVIAGKFREISPVLWVLAILLAAWYAFGGAA